jgi:two-component system NarL family sensor kinase
MRAELQVEGSERLPHAVQEELYHLAQEALNNTLKHAHAQYVQVRLRFSDITTRIEIEDDGMGFNVAAARASGGLGLRGMEERAQRIGGILDIVSAPGQGTKVSVEVPQGIQEG